MAIGGERSQQVGRVAAGIAGDDDGSLGDSHLERGSLSLRNCRRPCSICPGTIPSRDLIGPRPQFVGRRDQRGVELDVDLDRSGRLGAGPTDRTHRGAHRSGHHPADNVRVLAGGDIDTGTDIAEHLRLVIDGLVGAGPSEPGGTVRGQGDERQVPVRGLEDSGMEVGHRRPRRRHERHGGTDSPGLRTAHPQTPRKTEREEPGVALIEADVRADDPRLGEGGERVDERCGPGPGGEDDLPDSGCDQTAGDLLRHCARIRHHPIFNHLPTCGSR